VCFDSKQTLGCSTIVADIDEIHCSFSENTFKRLFPPLRRPRADRNPSSDDDMPRPGTESCHAWSDVLLWRSHARKEKREYSQSYTARLAPTIGVSQFKGTGQNP
jgi:hypothetical protein